MSAAYRQRMLEDSLWHYAGMGQHRAATLVLEEGCRLDPLNGQVRLQLESATQGVLRDLLEGMPPLLNTSLSVLQ